MDGCRITEGLENGHRALYLESDALSVTVLPEKGADIYALIHKPSGIDFLWKNPLGLAPPGAPPQAGSGDVEFLWNYEGAWQELFPSAGNATVYGGRQIPFHGEAALLAWNSEIVCNSAEEIAVRFEVATRHTPLRLERVMRLHQGESAIHFDETVTNVGDAEAHFVWGHHCVLGEPFLQAGCKLRAPARVLMTPDVLYEDTARLAPGQRGRWPLAVSRHGEHVDLSEIPGREAHSHDDVFLTDLQAGWVAVYNPHKNLTFSLHWDHHVFKWIINWQVYGGADAPPFNGLAYAVGIEPWVSNKPLGEAVAAGEAIPLAPGASFQTALQARISSGAFDPNTQ